MAKCPKCEQSFTAVNLSPVSANAGIGTTSWHALAYCCPHCQTAISVGIDPIALKTDTINGVIDRLRKG